MKEKAKMLTVGVLLTLVFIFFGLGVEGWAKVKTPARKCGSDSDCVVVEELCGSWASVNRDNEAKALEYLKAMKAYPHECKDDTKKPKPQAACISGYCETK